MTLIQKRSETLTMKIYPPPREYEKMFVINNHEKMSASRMAVLLRQPISWVNSFCEWMKIEPRAVSLKEETEKKLKVVVPEEIKLPIVRPAAVYSNRSPFGIATELMAMV